MAGSSSSQNLSSNGEENSAFDEFITHYDDSSDEEVSESFEELPPIFLKTFKSKAEESTWEKKDEFPLDKITKKNLSGNYLGRKLLYCKEVQDTYYQVKRTSFPALLFYDKASVIRNFKNWVEECLATTFTQIYDDFQNTYFKSYIEFGVLTSSRQAILNTKIGGKNFLDLAAENPRKFYRKFVLSHSVTPTNWDNELENLLNEIKNKFKSFIQKGKHFLNFQESLELTTENLKEDSQFKNAFDINQQKLLKEFEGFYQDRKLIEKKIGVNTLDTLTGRALTKYLDNLKMKKGEITSSKGKRVLMNCYAESLVERMQEIGNVDLPSNFAPYLVYMKSFLSKSTLHSQLGSFIKGYKIHFKNQELLKKYFMHMRNMTNEEISSFENRKNPLVTVRTANRLARRAIKNNTGFSNKIPHPVFHVFKYQFSKHPNSAAIEIEEINKNLARVSHVESVKSYYLIPGMINNVKETLNSFHENKGYNDKDFAYWIELCLKGEPFDNWPKCGEKGTTTLDFNSNLIGSLQFVSALTALLFYIEPKRNPSAFVYNLLVLDLVKKGECEWLACLVNPEGVDNPKNKGLKKSGGIMPMSKGGATCLSRWIHNAFNIPESGLGKYSYDGPLKSSTVIGNIQDNLESILEKETNLVEKWLSINKTYRSLKDLLAEFYFPSLTQQMSQLSV